MVEPHVVHGSLGREACGLGGGFVKLPGDVLAETDPGANSVLDRFLGPAIHSESVDRLLHLSQVVFSLF